MRVLSLFSLLFFAVAVAFPLLGVAVAYAQEAPGGSIEVGAFLAQFMPFALEILGMIVLALIGIVSVWLKRKLGLDVEHRHRQALHSAIMTGLGVAFSKLDNKISTYEVTLNSPAMNEVANYVLRSVPDAVRSFGLTEERIKVMAAGKLFGGEVNG